MTVALLILLPLAGALGSLLVRRDRIRRMLLVGVAGGHSTLVVTAAMAGSSPLFGGWLALDPLGTLFLGITSALFLVVALYGAEYLHHEQTGIRADFQDENLLFSNAPEARFTSALLFFLATMTLVTVSQHFGLVWVAIEATTLASAPLIYFHRHHRSLEATWKYLLICSVGIALALLGNLFLSISASFHAAPDSMMTLDLVRAAAGLDPAWLKAGFVLLLVGYGTKMGLAPLHTWLPDAHSEAPSMVSALLSGALLNCAFLGILRAQQVVAAAGLGGWSREMLLGLGLLSMAFAAAFILGQVDYKRMLAYSSVEHMGILCVGVGLGGSATAGAMLHAVNHSLTKAMLFLVAGNILATYKTKTISDVRGVLRVMPISGALWLLGLFAITGAPPFGPFVSEMIILNGAVEQGRLGVAAIYLLLLAVIFVGMATPMLKMAQGLPSVKPDTQPRLRRESAGFAAPPLALGLAVTALGLWVAGPLRQLAGAIAAALGGAS